MTDLHPFPESATTGSTTDSRRFRAETYEAAVAAATAELGPRVRVVEANRIRRGGLGGFFATDLGVEVTVVVDPPGRSGSPISGAEAAIGATGEPSAPGTRRGGSFDITEQAGFVADPRRRPLGDAMTPHEVPAPAAADTRRDDTFVDEVLALTDGGMESLLREIQSAADDRHDSFAAQLEHWDDRLDEDALTDVDEPDHDFVAQMGGPISATDDEATFAEQMLASARADLARQVERLQEAGRRRPLQDDVVASATPDAAVAEAAARAAATEQLDAARAAAAAQSAEAERVALARATAEQAIAERAEFDRLAAERREAERARAEAAAAEAAAGDTLAAADQLTEPVVEPVVESAQVDATAEIERPVEPAPVVESATASSATSERSHALIALDEMLRQVGVDMSSADGGRVTGTAATHIEASAEPTVLPAEQPEVEPARTEPTLPTAPTGFDAGTVSGDHDPLRRPTELAAAATDQLVSRLAAVVAADGSCLQDLHRVRVAVTTRDGMVIEMTAEMGGAS